MISHLIENSPSNMNQVRTILVQAGFRVLDATNTDEINLDWHSICNVLSGLEDAKVRANQDLKDLPILAPHLLQRLAMRRRE
jgi:hypothetical protein